MSLITAITSVTIDPTCDSYSRIQFTAADDDAVCFVDTITVAHACFLDNNVLSNRDNDAYSKMVRYIANTETKDLELQTFDSEDYDE